MKKRGRGWPIFEKNNHPLTYQEGIELGVPETLANALNTTLKLSQAARIEEHYV